jgi:hypothetical protein
MLSWQNIVNLVYIIIKKNSTVTSLQEGPFANYTWKKIYLEDFVEEENESVECLKDNI